MLNKTPETGFLPICPFENDLPEMLITAPERDERLNAVTGCDFSQNTEAYD
ncbi:MAG: hypothetical protein IKN17_06455 [Ruminococcus sp.]|nr:hypothetical protein [Ruminococcus sp.]